jgi:hypothetical protein
MKFSVAEKGSAAMTQNECKSLDVHLASKIVAGLVDIKFFVRSANEVPASLVCREASSIFDAINAGLIEEYRPNDSNRVAP